jgi:hypothetical protein
VRGADLVPSLVLHPEVRQAPEAAKVVLRSRRSTEWKIDWRVLVLPWRDVASASSDQPCIEIESNSLELVIQYGWTCTSKREGRTADERVRIGKRAAIACCAVKSGSGKKRECRHVISVPGPTANSGDRARFASGLGACRPAPRVVLPPGHDFSPTRVFFHS